MKAITKTLIIVQLFVLSSQTIYAQRPVTLDAESGNRNTDAALCWEFPGASHSNKTIIAGNFSSRTGQLTGGESNPNGDISPWIKFDGTGTIKWKMKLDKWAGVKYRKFVLIRVTPDKSAADIIFSYDFNEKNSESVYNGNVKIDFTGVYKLKFFFIGEGGSTRGILDDIIIDGDYWSAPSHNCEPKTDAPKDDDDGDGIPNNKDKFPKDPLRASECYYPATSGPGTLMFEDLWPVKGDYDFNDVVAEYKIRFTHNAQNNVVDVEMEITAKALGGANSNGLIYQFDKIKPSQIESVTGSFLSGSSWVELNANGTEANQNKANIIIFDNGSKLMPTGGYNVTNVDLDKQYITPVKTIINIKFKTDKLNAVYAPDLNFNPYLVANQKRGTEIHLPGYEPTNKANKALLGTGDDDSNLSAGKYYQTRNNLPWAIDVHTVIPYMQEARELSTGYSKFIKWALSNGTEFNDWYLNKPGYRNNNNIYIR